MKNEQKLEEEFIMKFELKVNKDQLKAIGNGAGKIGKSIIVEGSKAVALKGASAVISQGFDEGFGKVKELELDDMLAGGKKKRIKLEEKKANKKPFSFRKKKADETEELEVEIEAVDEDVLDVVGDTEDDNDNK